MKTLSEKKEQVYGKISGFSNIYYEDDVREAIKKIDDDLYTQEREGIKLSYMKVMKIIKQRMGEELTK